MQKNEPQQQMDGDALAARYHLGVPLKRYTHNLNRAAGIGCSVILMAFYLLLLLAMVEHIVQQQSILGWISLLVGLLLSLRLALVLIHANKEIGHDYAYECSEGFVVMSGHGQRSHVLMALRWDEISQAWKEKEKVGRIRYTRRYIRDRQGHRYRIEHIGIWRRCRKELAGRGLSVT